MPVQVRTPDPSEQARIRYLPLVVLANSFNYFFATVAFASSVLVLYLRELGLSKAWIGTLISAFPFCGVIAVLVSPVVMRFGCKKTFLIFYGIRKGVFLCLLLTPLAIARFGTAAGWWFVSACILMFALCRAIGETGYYPWNREFVPSRVRGKYTAAIQVCGTLFGAAALALASWFIGREAWGLARYGYLMAIATAFGLAGVVTYTFVPGGSPRQGGLRPRMHLLRMLGAMRDAKFRLLLIVLGMGALAGAPMVFLPTYLTERVGLSRGQVVWLDIATMAGNIVSAFFWGHWADRHGGRKLLLGSIVVGAMLAPLYLLLPGCGLSAQAAVGIALVGGVVGMAGQAGSSKLLFGDIVPPRRGQHYMAMWYAWSGLVGGIGPLAAGRALESLHWLRWDWGNVEIDAYVVLFVLSAAVSLATAAMLTRLKCR